MDLEETSLPWHLGIDVTVQKLKANAQRERSLRACFKRSDIPKRIIWDMEKRTRSSSVTLHTIAIQSLCDAFLNTFLCH